MRYYCVPIQWLQKESLLANSIQRELYDADCHQGVREKAIDGYMWRCKNHHKISFCRHSFFSVPICIYKI